MTAATTIVQVTGTEGLLSIVPTALGFHPTESLVMVCLTGPRHQVGPTCRVDLTDCAQQPNEIGRRFAEVAGRHAHEVALIVYSDRATHDAIATIAAAIGADTPCGEIIHVGNEPQQLDAHVAAETAGAGRAVLANRDELAASIAYVAHAPAGAYTGLLTELRTPKTRDHYLGTIINDPNALATLIDASRAVTDTAPHAADVLALLAAVAYRRGDGALAQCALTRAAAAQPGHRLTLLLQACLDAGIHPDELDTLADAPRA